MTTRRIEAPLPYSFDGSLFEPTAQRSLDPDAADTAVASNDDLENHVTLNSLATSLVRVDRPDFPDERGRIDPGSGLIHAAAGASTGARAEPAAAAFANPLTGTRAHAATIAGTTAWRSGRSFWETR